jgi:cytochrome P450
LSEVPRRRAGDGDDLFSQVCRAVDEDGRPLDPLAIADHMNF